MQMLKRSALLIFCFGYSLTVRSQEFGGNPASVKWKQINTDTVKIIFSPEMTAAAQRVASIIHAYQQSSPHTIGSQLRKVSIVLQNQTLFSNGYVSLAPYRSEFYTTPPQNPFQLGAVQWSADLALHEYRHVQQYSNFNKGLSKLATFVLGEQGQLVANAAAVPDWFFEGDAVYNETQYTQQGRGALPFFFNGYKSLLLSGRNYDFMKLRNGSLRSYVPDHYQLGYLLVAYGRSTFGEDIWQKITDDAVRFKPFFYPFQGAVRKYTRLSYGQFVNHALDAYKLQWSKSASEADWITGKQKDNVVNYEFPYTTADGKIIVLKTSQKNIPAFYSIASDGSEKKIAVRSISQDHYFSCNNGQIVYAAFEPDARWGNREFQSIRRLDINSGAEKTVVSHTRYFSPDISHNGNRYVVVNVDTAGNSSIVLLNAQGQAEHTITQAGLFFSSPKFSNDDASIYVAARNPSGEMSLLKYAVADGKLTDTLVYSYNRLIGYLTVQDKNILFTTTNEGRDELWCVSDVKDKRGPFRMASFSTGLYQGAFRSDGKLVAAAFTADGYRLASFQPAWQRVEQDDELKPLYAAIAKQTATRQFLASVPERNFPVTGYAKTHGLFNFHSFRPWYEQPEYSLTVYGQNVLNTFQSQLAYTYNQNEQSHKAGFNGVYGGSFLQPVFGISNTWNRSALLNKDTAVHWNELEWYAGLQLPLNLTGGKQYRYLTLSSTYRSDQVSWTGVANKLFADRNVQYLQSRLSFVAQTQSAVQQIYPHFGETLFLQYKNSVNGYTAQQFLASGSIYLPGFSNNHSIVLSAAYHGRDTMQQYLYSNNFPFARGYYAVDFPRMWKLGVNYHLPLAYPDWGFAQMVYFLRIRANLFFDYSEAKSLRNGIVYPFRSMGTEVFFDTRWWNQQPVTFGFRYSRLLDNEFRGATQPNVWEFVLPVSLFN